MALVCVTGGSGYVGSQVTRELLEGGHLVRTTRDRNRASTHLAHLGDSLELVEADLRASESIAKAVAGCDFVIHTASPYVLSVVDAQRDLVEPAVIGTLSVLAAAAASPSVQRVVVTSSFAAVTDEPDGVFTEEDWNTRSSLTRNPYYFSKAESERAAWDFASRRPGFDLVVINPSVILGPSLVRELNTSARTLIGLVTGVFPAVIDLDYALVDVRDVATAHRLAIENPAAHGRYLCTAETWSQRRLVDWIKGANLGYGNPPRLQMDNKIGTLLAKFAARFQDAGERDYIFTHIGRHPSVDTTKIRKELGLTFRPVGETLIDAYRDLEKWGHLSKRPRPS